jgi:hypothetical protein
MGGKSSPKAPDYEKAAIAQGEASKEVTEQQTWANRPTQMTPWGSTYWGVTPVWDPTTEQYINTWTQNTDLDPTLKKALEDQMYLQGERSALGRDLMARAAQEYGQSMDWSQLPGWGQGPDAKQMGPLDYMGAIDTSGMQGMDMAQLQQQLGQTPEEIRNRAEQAIYQRATSRLDPQFEQMQGDMESKLIAQGLRPGDAAYDRAMDNFARQREDAYQTAMTESIMGGGQEGQRQYEQMLGSAQFSNAAAQQNMQNQMALREKQFMEEASKRGMSNEEATQEWNAQKGAQESYYNQQMQSANYANQMRAAQLAQMMQQRGFSLNEINALISGQQVGMPQMPNFSNAGAAQETQYLNAANMQGQADLNQFNAQQAGVSNLMGGLGSIAGFAFSDRRLKRDIVRIGKTPGGQNVYAWNYLWGQPAIGVMADESPADAVIMHESGYLMVNYGRIK